MPFELEQSSNFEQPSDFEQPSEVNDANNENTMNETTQPTLRCSNRTQNPINEYVQSVSQQTLTFEPQAIHFNNSYEARHEGYYTLQHQMVDPIAFLATKNKDTLYYHEAMKAPDRDNFLISLKNCLFHTSTTDDDI